MTKDSILNEMANFVFTSKYARYNETKKRRETWEEAVSRVEAMHLKRFKALPDSDKEEIKNAFTAVKEKLIVPSMRSMQFGGTPIEAHEARGYNCSVRHIDSSRAFAEVFYLSLCGCGIGVGLQKQFLDRLPDLVSSEDKTGIVVPYVVQDTIEGWADTIEALLNCYFKNTAFTGRKLVFDFSRIRRKGSKIKTGGGKAPGYKPLKNALSKIKNLLDSLIEDKKLSRLRSIDVCDIICHCSDAVLAGGVRRSALAMIFDKGDDLMMSAKTGNWFNDNPQRARANNSVLLLRSETSEQDFIDILNKSKEFGEPGFVFANDNRQLLNPCFTIDTKILTSDGWRSFEQLLELDSVTILQDQRVQGFIENGVEKWQIDNSKSPITISNKASNIRKTASNREVYSLTLACGRTVKATNNHHFATKNGMVELKDLKVNDEILIPVNELHQTDKKSDDFRLGYLAGMWFGDGTTAEKGVLIDIWSNDKNPSILSKIEGDIAYLVDKYEKVISFRTNVNKYPKFVSCTGIGIGNVAKYRLHSSLLKQIFTINGINEKDCADWLHSKSKDLKAGFISGLFYCDGHTEYNKSAKTLSVRLCSINFDLLKNVQLVLQELGIFSRINDLIEAGYSMLPDSNREYKKYKTKKTYRLIIGGRLNAQTTLTVLDLHEKDVKRIEYANNASQRTAKNKFYSKVKDISFLGKEDVYCLQEDNRRTLIAEGMTARRCFEVNFIPETDDEVCGVQMCNLTSINGAKTVTKEIFLKQAKYAALIGTLQAAYTNFKYLGRASKIITEQEALLGVSITGEMDNPQVLLVPENQKEAALLAVSTNEEWAAKIGINPAARVTVIKPEGTSSIVLGASSGIHPHHARQYFRRIQCNKLDNVYNFFKIYNPDACEESVWSANKTDDVVTFPVTVPDTAMVKSDLDAIKHLEIIKSTQENWVNYGTSKSNKKNIKHSVSCTVLVDNDEWDKVAKYLYDNRESFTAVSLLPKSGDKIYQQAPMEAVLTEDDKKKFDYLVKSFESVDYSKLEELHDETKLQEEVACSGTGCELK